MAKLNKQIEKVDQLCTEIAMLELDNWDVIQRFKVVEHQINTKYRELEKLCDRGVIRKKVEEIQSQYGTPRKPRRGGLVVKRRLNASDKILLTRAMLEDFKQQKLSKVSLDEINEWLSQPRNQGSQDLRDKLLIRGITIPQVNWFHVRTKSKGREQITKLYDAKSYETKKAPYKSYFNVQAWQKYLKTDKKICQIVQERNKEVHGL